MEGMFLLPLQAGTGLMGAISMHFNLGVSTPNKKVSGVGHIFQSTNPPMDIHLEVSGDFSYMTVMPKNTHILLVLNGNNSFKARIVLDESWQEGSGTFSFVDDHGNQHVLEGIPVKLAAVNKPTAARAK
jgi:Domain of unknown function (DUF1842).